MKRILALMVCVILLSAWSTAAYSREHTDQEMTGNAGYLMGTPPEEKTPSQEYHPLREIPNPLMAIWNGVQKVDEWFEQHFW